MGMHNPAHPGEILKELVIDSLGLSAPTRSTGSGGNTPLIFGRQGGIPA